jgi:hypothetical protein
VRVPFLANGTMFQRIRIPTYLSPTCGRHFPSLFCSQRKQPPWRRPVLYQLTTNRLGRHNNWILILICRGWLSYHSPLPIEVAKWIGFIDFDVSTTPLWSYFLANGLGVTVTAAANSIEVLGRNGITSTTTDAIVVEEPTNF